MKIAFYKASTKPWPGKIWSWSIAHDTGGPYSHCELVFSDKPALEPYICFSSSEQDRGTRFKTIDIYSGHWDYIEVPELDGLRAWKWCWDHNNLKYDWRGLRGFVLPWEKPDPKDLFCSEAVVECLQDQGLLKHLVAGKTSPNGLARALGFLKPERMII